MIEITLTGTRSYWLWIIFLMVLIVVGCIFYVWQYSVGLVITGLSRDVTWGFYLAQLTFLVGVAASAVMVVLPYYLHDFKRFGSITIIGEFTAVSAVITSMLFLFVDLGQPFRVVNVFLYPSPQSMVFWDANILIGYLILNIVIGWNVLTAERKQVAPPRWIKPLIYLSIPWAFAIHTVTAYLYCGLPGRSFWFTAILAPRFLASAFASGPALLILLCLFIRATTRFKPDKAAIQALAMIVTYGMMANLFFLGCELFVTFYGNVPGHMDHFRYLYTGIDGDNALVVYMWLSLILMILAQITLLIPRLRRNETVLAFLCGAVFIGIWIDKGMGLITGGFVPNPLHEVVEYLPTVPELLISLGVFAIGAFILTILLKIAVAVKVEAAG